MGGYFQKVDIAEKGGRGSGFGISVVSKGFQFSCCFSSISLMKSTSMRWRCKTGEMFSSNEYPTVFLFPGSHLIIEIFLSPSNEKLVSCFVLESQYLSLTLISFRLVNREFVDR